ncbi:MAG: FG-GAP repeat protein [Ignavibacteriales bacterium]|nr:MAG: FG-GAP repeat protein [Ignavibacteriales bacterium]
MYVVVTFVTLAAVTFPPIDLDVSGNTQDTFSELLTGSAGTGHEPPSPDAVSRKQIIGQIPGGGFGASVSGAGDINGDGLDDFIIGAPNISSDKGRVYIYLGPVRAASVPYVIDGENAGDLFGSAVAIAGDLNRDGFADIVIGAKGFGSSAGKTYILFGGEDIDVIPDLTVTGQTAGDLLGCSVSSAGDVNLDTFTDLIIGSSGYNSSAGRAYILLGGANMNNTPDIILNGSNAGDNFGCSVSLTGDINGDTYEDVIVGSSGHNSNQGKAEIFFGGAAMNSTADIVMLGESAGDYFGHAVALAGDVNGDYYADVIVGAYGYSSNRGRAYIYLGSSQPDNTADFTFTGETAGDYFGFAVSSAGDMRSGGYSDILIGAHGYSGNTGRIYVFSGAKDISPTPREKITGENSNSYFGYSVAMGGNFDGDGYSSFMAGAHNYLSAKGMVYFYKNMTVSGNSPDYIFTDGKINAEYSETISGEGDLNGDGYPDFAVVSALFTSSDTGKIYIYFGGPLLDNVADKIIKTPQHLSYFGVSMSSSGDLNGDGFADLIVGGNQYSTANNTNRGRVWVYLGGSNMDTIPDLMIDGEAALNHFGVSVGHIGDVNGDGYGDFMASAYNYGGGLGRIYLYYGGAVLDGVYDLKSTGPAANGLSWGRRISGAGDVNGDGFADAMFSSYGYNSQGRVYILYGGAAMDSVIDVTLTGEASSNLGISLASAGDVNGDGYGDIVVGASTYSSSTGRAYIYYGGSSMSTSASVTLTGTSGSRLGSVVSTAGDQNNDGYSDILVTSSPNSLPNTSLVQIYYGGANMDSQADIIRSSYGYDLFASSAAYLGDINGDRMPDYIIGAPDRSNSNLAGKAYLYLSYAPQTLVPKINYIRDVPGDDGGQLTVNWLRIGYDVPGDTVLSEYTIERTLPGGIFGNAWEEIASVTPRFNVRYSYTIKTPVDSNAKTSGVYYYRIVARGADKNDYWISNMVPAYSVDNLSPLPVQYFSSQPGGNGVTLVWKENRESDLYGYYIYRSSNSHFNPDSLSPIAVTRDTTYTDTAPLEGSLYYFIRAQDKNGNFSSVVSNSNNPLPVELDLFSARINGKNVVLNWRTQTEINIYSFTVERKVYGDVKWDEIGEVQGSMNSNSPKRYSFTDYGVLPGKYIYRLAITETDGYKTYSPEALIDFGNPQIYSLSQNYPNPFNPLTTIEFSLPAASAVKIAVYDMLGNRVSELLNEKREAGYYSLPFDASALPSGVYVYRIEAGEFTSVKKMTLIK